MSTLEAELLQAAKRADIAAWLHDKRRNIAEYEEAVAESAGLRARAARVREGLTEEPNGMLSWACGPLSPDSAGGADDPA